MNDITWLGLAAIVAAAFALTLVGLIYVVGAIQSKQPKRRRKKE